MAQPVITRYAPNLYRLDPRQVLTLENAIFLARDFKTDEGKPTSILVELSESQREFFTQWEITVRDQMKDTPGEIYEWHSNLVHLGPKFYLRVKLSKLSEVVEELPIGLVSVYTRPLKTYKGQGTFTITGSKVWIYEVGGVMKCGIAWYIESLKFRTLEKVPPSRTPTRSVMPVIIPP